MSRTSLIAFLVKDRCNFAVDALFSCGRAQGNLWAMGQSTFSSFPKMAVDLDPYLPAAALLSRYEYNTAEYLAKIQRPVLIIHGWEVDLKLVNRQG